MARFDLDERRYDSAGARVAIVAARFNHEIVDGLLRGTLATLAHHGIGDPLVDVWRAPGAFELPLVAKRLAASGAYAAIIALGAVVRGDTPHFDYVAGECARGLAALALERDLPIIFGVLTTDDMEQARARSGEGDGNKGHQVALATLEMIGLLRAIDAATASPGANA